MAGVEDPAGAKRKREDGGERKSKAARHSSARQERLEEEFGELYFGPTSLYKLLELRQLQQPALLPRSLSYRLAAARKATAGAAAKVESEGERELSTKKKKKGDVVGATLREIKLAITADLTQSLAKENGHLGLRLAIYSADGRSFADNRFTPVAECMIPVPCSKNVRIPKEVLQASADIVVATFQVVTIGDFATRLAGESKFEFTTAKSTAIVLGKDLLSAEIDGKAPLYGNMLRIYPAQHRRGSYEVELPVISSTLGGGVKCLFELSWDALPIESKMKRLDRIAKAKFVADSSNEPVNGKKFQLAVPSYTFSRPTVDECPGVWFHYLYHSMLRRLSEKRLEYSCALCNMHAGSLRGLMTHLVCSHDRFRFQATVGHDSVPHIYVMVINPRPRAFFGESEKRSALCELELNRNDELDRCEHHFTYLSSKKGGVPGPHTETVERLMGDLDELEEIAEEKDPEFYAPLLQRQYFHSRTGAVVLDHEKDYDSDDDVDEEWIIQQSEKLLDEFEDVALEEKEFMKKWNRHVKEHKILADFMVATSCRHFAKLHGKWLIDHGLRHNFLLHLLNLWDNSLLNSRAIIDCMLIVDHIADNDAATNSSDKVHPHTSALPASVN